MTTVPNGVLGGLLVGLVAAVVTRFVGAGPVAADRTPDGSAARPWWLAVVVLAAYGGLAGGLLVGLELYLLGVLAVPPTAVEAFGVAIAWSALLFVAAAVVSRAISSAPADRSLLVYHLVYGLGFGVWIRVTWIT